MNTYFDVVSSICMQPTLQLKCFGLKKQDSEKLLDSFLSIFGSSFHSLVAFTPLF